MHPGCTRRTYKWVRSLSAAAGSAGSASRGRTALASRARAAATRSATFAERHAALEHEHRIEPVVVVVLGDGVSGIVDPGSAIGRLVVEDELVEALAQAHVDSRAEH